MTQSSFPQPAELPSADAETLFVLQDSLKDRPDLSLRLLLWNRWAIGDLILPLTSGAALWRVKADEAARYLTDQGLTCDVYTGGVTAGFGLIDHDNSFDAAGLDVFLAMPDDKTDALATTSCAVYAYLSKMHEKALASVTAAGEGREA